MNESLMDRIVIKDEDGLMKVLRWYENNREWIHRQEFHAPLESGMIQIKPRNEYEYQRITFEPQGKNVILKVSYPAYTYKRISKCACVIEYDPQQGEVLSATPEIPQNDEILGLAFKMIWEQSGRTEDYPLLHYAIMQFMTYYKENVEVQQQRFKPMPYMKNVKRNGNGRPISIIRKTYTIKDFDVTALKVPENIKRAWTAPSHEVGVRGHMRHLKSGKVVWVKPFTRYKGKEMHVNEYKL
jgi:hypothetical protein